MLTLLFAAGLAAPAAAQNLGTYRPPITPTVPAIPPVQMAPPPSVLPQHPTLNVAPAPALQPTSPELAAPAPVVVVPPPPPADAPSDAGDGASPCDCYILENVPVMSGDRVTYQTNRRWTGTSPNCCPQR